MSAVRIIQNTQICCVNKMQSPFGMLYNARYTSTSSLFYLAQWTESSVPSFCHEVSFVLWWFNVGYSIFKHYEQFWDSCKILGYTWGINPKLDCLKKSEHKLPLQYFFNDLVQWTYRPHKFFQDPFSFFPSPFASA
jgi:hypothetical protein